MYTEDEEEELKAVSDKFWKGKIEEARANGGWVTFPVELIPSLPNVVHSVPDMPKTEEGKYVIMYGVNGCTLILPGARYDPPVEQYTWIVK